MIALFFLWIGLFILWLVYRFVLFLFWLIGY
jgi:hypothetical protein